MRAFLLVVCLTFSNIILAQESPVIEIETTMGNIQVELRADLTPVTVENFLRYIDNNYYDGLIFHRVISGFMIQGGGFDANICLLYTSPSPRDLSTSRMPSSA